MAENTLPEEHKQHGSVVELAKKPLTVFILTGTLAGGGFLWQGQSVNAEVGEVIKTSVKAEFDQFYGPEGPWAKMQQKHNEVIAEIGVQSVQQENTNKELEEIKKRQDYLLQRIDAMELRSRSGGGNHNENRINIGDNDPLPAYLTPRQLAHELGEHEDTTRKRIHSGEIPEEYIKQEGRYYLISSSYLDEL